MKALLDIPIEVNQTLNIIKAQFGLKNKAEAISHVVNVYKKEHMEPEIRPEYARKILAQRDKKGFSFKTIEELRKHYEERL